MRQNAFVQKTPGRLVDPRGQNTRSLLIECAETMVGEYGINGVSIRQIAKACHSANSSVVAYHFGDKETLLRAVIKHRLPAIEQRRSELLTAMQRSIQSVELSELIDILFRPFFEQQNESGRRSYAAFVDELSRANLIDIRTSLNADYPVTAQILNEMQNMAGNGCAERFGHSIFLASALIFAAIRKIDQMALGDDESANQFTQALISARSVVAAKS